MSRAVVASLEARYETYKALAQGVIDQLDTLELSSSVSAGSNSLATLVWHVSGNLASRFTDFLGSDGEKPWRHRESEFEERQVGRAELLEKWEHGWAILAEALAGLDDDDLSRTVTIRGMPLSVVDALHRSLAHVSYHVGQMVFLGKIIRGGSWTYLSIPPGMSEAYNRNPTPEGGARGAGGEAT